jgi:methylenetetrahydrofolate reductase (NADPH)
MRLRDIYRRESPVASFEFFPPKTEQGVVSLRSEVERLQGFSPGFCSVTYGAGGSTRQGTVDLVCELRDDYGLEVMCHLTAVNQSRDEVRAVLDDLGARGIENIIALRGDPPGGTGAWLPHPDGFRHSIELVREATARGFSVAVAGFPETHPEATSRDADLGYLREKVEAGADAVITQLFFDNDDYYRFADDLTALGVTVPIVPGVLPIISPTQTRRFTSLCGSRIPERLQLLLDKVDGDDEGARQLGIEYATEQCRALIDFGAPGLHFYTLNRAGSVSAILTNLCPGQTFDSVVT